MNAYFIQVLISRPQISKDVGYLNSMKNKHKLLNTERIMHAITAENNNQQEDQISEYKTRIYCCGS